MIELVGRGDQPPLQLASRVVSAPGVWVPDSRLPLEGLGALVTPPLAGTWQGGAAGWEARPGALHWAPPTRPLTRTLRRLAREGTPLPRIFTLAPLPSGELEAALRELEGEEVGGLLLWDATPEAVRTARRGAAHLPLLAEIPYEETRQAAALVEAGASALWLGPPRAGASRLWGPAVLPLVLHALENLAPLPGLRVAGAGIASAADAAALCAAGADVVALGPEWWVQPGLLAEVVGVV